MPKPTDLHAACERRNAAEHDAVYGAARDDVTRLFDHYAQKVGGVRPHRSPFDLHHRNRSTRRRTL